MIPPEAARWRMKEKSLLAAYRKRRDSYARRLLGLRLGEWERFESRELASKCFRAAWNGPGMGLRRFIVFVLFLACYLGMNRAIIFGGFLSVDQQITVCSLSSLVMVFSDSIVSISSAFLFRRLLRRHLRRTMNNNGMSICVECGYNLTGAPSARCPECGAGTQFK